jgi:polysaccharide biosynthesis protein PslJ
MDVLRKRELPPSAWALLGAIGLCVVGAAAGGKRAEIPALILVALIAGRGLARVAAHWSWMIGAALVVDLVLPEDGRYTIPAGFVNLEPYRVVVGIVLIGWFAALLSDPNVRARSTKFEGPIGLILIATVGSELLNPGRVSGVGTFVLKSLSLFACFVLFLYMTVSVIRSRDVVNRLIALLVSAGCIEALGAVVQREKGYNIFDHLHRFVPMFQFSLGAELNQLSRNGSLRAVGSAGHPIELSNVMVMLMPLAVYLAIVRRQKRWWVAVLILGVGALASGSKTGMIEMIGVLLVFAKMRPGPTLRCWPALIPIVVVMNIVVPGSISGIIQGFFPKGGFVASQSATFYGHGQKQQATRLSRIGPELHSEYSKHNPLFGEGYGTRIVGRLTSDQQVPAQNQAQVLDDQWFGTFLETGLFGFLGWLWLFVHVMRKLGKRAKLEREHPEGWLPVALASSIMAFLIGMATYDAFGFIQAVLVLYAVIAFSSIVLQLPPLTTRPPARGGVQRA